MSREDNGVATDLSTTAAEWTRPAAIQNDARLFGPGQPALPAAPEEHPRLFEYMPGVNLVTIPRMGFGLASFQALRNLAATCKEVRLNIELIKREIRALDWAVQPVNEALDIDPGPVTAALESPDGQHEFDPWLNMLLEEMLVTDAVTIYPAMTLGGQVEALDLIDGTTIRPLLTFRGRTPRPPSPAYLQILHGVTTGYWDSDKLIYRPFNTTIFSPYGTSPIEFIMMTVNLALRRDVHHVSYFTEGNVPEALVGAPSSWTQQQVETWQKYWDAMVQGNIAEMRKMHFVPLEGGRGSVPVYEFRKDDVNQTVQDEWLLKVACWAFGNSPAEFGLVTGSAGLGGAGYMEGQENIQYRSMIRPITQYLERLITGIIQRQMKQPLLKFIWTGLEPQGDKVQQAQVDQAYINARVYGPGYVRRRLGIKDEEAQVVEPAFSPVAIPPGFGTPAGSREEPAEKFFQGYG